MSWLSKLVFKKPADKLHRFLPAQQRKFTRANLRTTQVRTLNLDDVNQLFEQSLSEILAIDIGGTKVSAATYTNAHGVLQSSGLKEERDTARYLDFLLALKSSPLPVSVSFAGPIEGSKPLAGPNVPELMNGLQKEYQGDFHSLFPTLKSVTNDAVAGLAAGAFAAKKKFPDIKNVLYLINGSGIGGAVLKENTIFAIEPGHVEIIPELNIFGQTKSCGMLGAEHICIESVAGGKAGIIDAWFRKTNQVVKGEYIAEKARNGDAFARSLYNHSALMMAYVVKGILNVFDMNPEETAVVFHGGVFAVDGYAGNIKKSLEREMRTVPFIMLTSEFSENACLEGAAILGWLVSSSRT